MNRRKLRKLERQRIYAKTGGRCAYCGHEITLQQMQVDHIVPLYNGGTEDTANYLPACRSCNHYKSTLGLEKFRVVLERMPDVLARDSVTYRNAVRFGLVSPTPHPVVFYFESHPPEREEDT